MQKSDDQWKDSLTPEQYHVCRQQGTEPPFTGKYVDHKGDGVFCCVCCGAQLFDASTKFDSGTGWPSFYDCVDNDALTLIEDKSHGMVRTEVRCNACDAHLGHVFEDGPNPTGLRYCINSVSLDFTENENES